MASPSVNVEAPAKINLTLEVVGKRADGYHDICSVMQSITLADLLTLTPTSGDLSVACNVPELAGKHNLALRAAELLKREAGVPGGAHIALEKRIPVAAGLGGGSADAAATLLGLDALWGLGLARERLRALGAQLGSDVPFFLVESGIALAEGRGERLSPLRRLPDQWVVLLKPPVGIAARDVYAALPSAHYSDGTETTAWLEQARQSGRVPPPVNRMESVALGVEPRAAIARDALHAAGAARPIMSGSGSAYFALFESEGDARLVHNKLGTDFGEAIIARFAPHGARLIDETRSGDDHAASRAR